MFLRDDLGGISDAVCSDMFNELWGSIQTFSHGTGYVIGAIFCVVCMELRWLLSYQREKPIEEKMLILRFCLNHGNCQWSLNNVKC